MDGAQSQTLKAFFSKHWGKLLVTLLVCIAGAVAFGVSRVKRVNVVSATRRDLVQTIVASGRVLPAARIDIAAIAVGRVTAVAHREGDRVEAGETLATLDDGEANALLARAEAAAVQARARFSRVRGQGAANAGESLRRAETDLVSARLTLTRLQQVARVGGVAEEALTNAESTVARLESMRETARITLNGARGLDGVEAGAALAQAEADVAVAQLRIANLTIVAPAKGVLVARTIEVGDVVSTAQPLFELAVDGALRVRIDPDESALALVALDQTALVVAEAFPEDKLTARVSYIAPAVDPLRGTIEVRLNVDVANARLRPDMTVTADIEVARRPSALSLPTGAVRDVGTETPWVLVIENGLAARRNVQLGAIGEDAIEILSGLQDGQAVIPSTVGGVAVGARVRAKQ